jgi:hypothetical protein
MRNNLKAFANIYKDKDYFYHEEVKGTDNTGVIKK